MKSLLKNLRNGATAATVSVAVLATGAAAIAFSAVPGPSAPTPTASASLDTTESVALAVGGQMAIPVEDAGVVTIARDSSSLTVVQAAAEPGWQALIDVAQGREVEVSFRSDGVRHDLNVELEDGVVRIRIRTRAGQIEDNVGSTSTSSSTTVPGSSSSTSVPSSSSSSTSTTIPSAPATAGPPRTVDVLEAGTATFVVDNGQLVITDVTANDGWTVNVERATGREVEATWRGPGRVDLNLELEDGQIRVRIRDRRTDSRTEVRISVNGDSSSTGSSSSSSTSTTLPSSSSSDSASTTSTVPGSTSQPAASFTETVASAGGTVVVRVDGDDVFLVSADAAAGYSADIRRGGPDEVEVRFEAGDNESRIKLRVDDGRLRKEIEDR